MSHVPSGHYDEKQRALLRALLPQTMTKRTYPYKAWTLQPSFKPIEVELTAPAWPNSTVYPDWDTTTKGKHYHINGLFPSKEEAIAHGWKEIERIQADLDKRNETLRKKRAVLNQAAGKNIT